MAKSIYSKTLPITSHQLFIPDTNEMIEVISNGLKGNFAEVSVDIVDCPDLTKEPFHLACPGICGKAKVLDVGGPPNLLPLPNREKLYNLQEICNVLEADPAFLIGAGAGPWPYVGYNCEGAFNLSVINNKLNQKSRIAKIIPKDAPKGESECKVEILPEDEARCALMANLLLSEGKPGKVIRVECKKRTGSDDFITSMRKSLTVAYKDKFIGLGGTFLLKEGKSNEHIMPDFSEVPLNSDEEVDEWLHFFDMSAPLINVGTFVSNDPGLDLRLQHFHTFSLHGEGGHYHYDTTPETAHYIGYFTVAETLLRIDQPSRFLQFGKD